MVSDAVALLRDVDAATVEVSVEPVTEHDEQITRALAAKTAADEAVAAASTLQRQLTATLVAEQMSYRDVGTLLHVSPQRIGQLLRKKAS